MTTFKAILNESLDEFFMSVRVGEDFDMMTGERILEVAPEAYERVRDRLVDFVIDGLNA